MSFEVAGFNVFNQWCSEDLLIKKFTKINLWESNMDNHFEVLFISWSYNLLRIDKKLCISGLSTGNKKQVREIQLPKEISCAEDIFVTGTDHYILMLDKINLTLWKSSFGANSSSDWFKVPPFWSVETSQTATESAKQNIVAIKSSCTMNLCLCMEGHIYDIPQRINISHCIGKIKQLDCGYEHAIIVTDLGNVYTWGNGRRCQLGHGDLSNVEEPQLVEALAGVKIVCVRAGGWHSCAISEAGDLYTWGWNQAGQLGLGKPQKYVPDNATELKKSTKYIEETVTSVAFPTLVDLYENKTNFRLECDIVDVACGSKHTAIVLRDKSIWTTGSNTYCQLGIDFDIVPYSKHFQKVRQDDMNCSLLCGPWSTVIRHEV